MKFELPSCPCHDNKAPEKSVNCEFVRIETVRRGDPHMQMISEMAYMIGPNIIEQRLGYLKVWLYEYTNIHCVVV